MKSKKQQNILKKAQRKNNYYQSYYISHFQRFNAKIGQYGLYINDVEADGNCLFRAIADQLENNESSYQRYRKLALSQIKKRKSFYQEFLPEEIQIDDYIQEMAKDGAWGGHLELQALSEELGIQIVVHSIDTFVIIGEHKEQLSKRPHCFVLQRICNCLLQICSINNLEKKINIHSHRTIHIAFHKGQGFQKHYSSVKGHHFSLSMLPPPPKETLKKKAEQSPNKEENDDDESYTFQPSAHKEDTFLKEDEVLK